MHLPILFAYIDPGSGTYVLQFLLAGVAAFVWRVASLFTRRKKVVPAMRANSADAAAQSAEADHAAD